MTETRTLEILEKLVAFDTTSANSNLGLIDWVTAYLQPFGCTVERFVDETGEKASVWITWGPADRPGYVLSGHSDVVPVTGQKWTSDAFRTRVADGRAYGRGTVDMKGFLAACLAMAPDFGAGKLTQPIHLAISYDEEVGCKGVRPMLAAIAARKPKPIGCFVGEPTEMAAIVGHKGKVAYTTTVTGEAGHSSCAPRFVNALDYGARIVAEIAKTADFLEREGRRDDSYDIPFTTVVATGMRAGTARNIVPDRCEIDWECRSLDEVDRTLVEERIFGFARDSLLPEMQTRNPGVRITFEKTIDYPGLAMDPAHPVVGLAQALNGKTGVAKVAFGTEAGLFHAMGGIPSVVIGPGSIGVAHQPDEYIEVSQLGLCGEFIGRLLDHCRL